MASTCFEKRSKIVVEPSQAYCMKIGLEKKSQKLNIDKCSDIASWSNWFKDYNITCSKILKRKCMVDKVIVNKTNCSLKEKKSKCIQCKKNIRFRNKREVFNSSSFLHEKKTTKKMYNSLKEMVQLTNKNSTHEESGDVSFLFYSFWPGFVTGFACCAGVIVLFFTCYKLVISINKWKNLRRNAELKLYYAKPSPAWQRKITNVIKRSDPKDDTERSIIESYVNQSTKQSTKNYASSNPTIGHDDSGYQADEDQNDVIVQGKAPEQKLKNVKSLQQRRSRKKENEGGKHSLSKKREHSPPLIRFYF